MPIYANPITQGYGGENFITQGYLGSTTSTVVPPKASSVLRGWYYDSLVYPRSEGDAILLGQIVPQFFGLTNNDRIGYRADYVIDHRIPPIKLIIGTEETVIGEVATYKSLLYEKRSPVYYPNKTILLKNLAMVSLPLTCVNGVISLASSFISHPIIEDSILTVTSIYDDMDVIYPDSPQFDGTNIYLAVDGDYTVRYLSQTIHQQLLNGTAYITIDNVKVNIKYELLSNVWDEYALWDNFSRKSFETNNSLKSRCQHLSLLKKSENRISALLGQSSVFAWDTTSSLNLSGSSITDFEIFDTSILNYIEEIPIKDGNNFLLTYIPSNTIQVFLNTVAIDSSNYTLSGNAIIPATLKFQQADVSSVLVKYTTTIYSLAKTSNYVDTISRANNAKESLLVIATKNVLAEAAEKKIPEFRWSRSQGLLTGLSNFS